MAKEATTKKETNPIAVIGGIIIGIGLIGLIIYNPLLQQYPLIDRFEEFGYLVNDFYYFQLNHNIYNFEKDIYIINVDSYADIKLRFDNINREMKEAFIIYKSDEIVDIKTRIANILSILIILFGFIVKNSHKDISFTRRLIIPITGTIFFYAMSFFLFILSVLQANNII